jgi:3-hydroxyisobutyrate dehydrogenase
MGSAMAARLVRAGHDLAVFNRTRAKTETLVEAGAKAVESVSELARREIVFVTVASSDDLLAVLDGEGGLFSGDGSPRIVVDCSTVSSEASAMAREIAGRHGTKLLAAPVSGNPKVVRAGRLTMAVSGPRDAFEEAAPYLEAVCAGVTYVGAGEAARLVKLCHNLFLGAVIEALVEVTVLAERSGVRRGDFLEFLNASVLGSTFTRYKTPGLVNLDFAPTFTTNLLRKDFDLGLKAARDLEVPMPVAALVHQLIQIGVGSGYGELDFATLLLVAARGAALELTSEDRKMGDGLEPPQDTAS